jgi:hypothetical protein
MFNDEIKSTVIGTVKIYDKDSGEILVQKRNAIHPGNVAYIIAAAMAGTPTNVNPAGSAPSINWMAFGNGGSSSTTTLSYKSPRVSTVYDGLPINASSSNLYAKTYQQETVNTVYYPGQVLDTGAIIPNRTSKVNFKVELSHSDMELYIQQTDPSVSLPTTDSSTDTDSVNAFTFDEIGLVAGVTDSGELDESKSTLVTHVTFHPVLVSQNRTIIIDYMITIQIG